MTHNQELILRTLQEHDDAGGEAIGNSQIAREANRRHNRWFSYDALHSGLSRMQNRGWVRRDSHKPTRWSITDAGRAALAEATAAE